VTSSGPRQLADENVPGPAIAALRERGRDVVWIAENAAGATDAEVMLHAAKELRWLITFDRDYGELVFRGGRLLPPAVVLLRMARYRPAEPAHWIERILGSEKASVGGFLVFDERGLRWRPLPAGHG
jgi:predicted nuclease of predicted toxin-antitoxin system